MRDKVKFNSILNVFMLVVLLSSVLAQPIYGATEVASELSSKVSESQEKELETEEVVSEETEETVSEETDSEETDSEEETNEANAPPVENKEALSQEVDSEETEEITTITDLSNMSSEELKAYFDDKTNEVLFIDTTDFKLPENYAYSVGVTTSPEDLSVFNSSMWGEFSIYKVNGKYVYCIEPGVNASSSASSTGESGSIYSKFKTATKREIGRIISSSQQHYKDSGNTDWLFAGQMMIWSYLAIHEDALMTHSYGTYNAYASSRYSSEATTIQKELDEWTVRPSFMGSTSSAAKGHTLKYNESSDQFELTLKDTNGVWDSKFANYNDFGSYVVTNPAGANNVKIVSKTAHSSYTSARAYTWKPYATGEALFYDAGQDLAYVGSDPLPAYMKFKTEAMPLGGFRIKKVDSESGEALAGAQFTLYEDSNNNNEHDSGEAKVDTYTTNENGLASSGGKTLTAGNYVLIETKAPKGYIIDDTAHSVTITANTINDKTATPYKNTMLDGGLKLLKVDSETGDVLAGAEFDLYHDENNNNKIDSGEKLEASYSTDSNGVISSGKNIFPGDYVIVETKAPAGYNLDDTEYELTIKADTVNTHYFDNPVGNYIIKGGLKLEKTDVDTGDTLAGAEFDLVDSNGIVVDSFSTNADGIYSSTLEAYRPGTYTLVETKAPTNYVLPTDNEYDVTIEANELNTVYFDTPITNEIIKGGFELTKLGEIFQLDNEALDGVEFTVTSTTYPDFNKVYTTDKNGQIITSDDELRFGDYHIAETYAPSKYVIDFEQDFSINEDGLIVMLNGGEDIINKLYLNKIHGLKVAENFDNNDSEMDPLAGTTFGIYEELGTPNGKVDRQDHLIDLQVTDENGEFTSIELPEGNYVLKEIEPTEGYNLNETNYPFEIKNDGTLETHSTIGMGTIENEVITGRAQLIKVGSKLCDKSISKPDTVKDCQTLLPDVSFGVYQDLNNNDVLDKNESKPVDVMTTDEGGLAVTNELKFGHYFVKELNNPADNYFLNENLFDFTISEQDSLEFINNGVAIENIEKLGNIHIAKSGKEIGNLNTDNVTLANTEYTIYNSDGQVEDVLTTDENGEATSTLLSFGDYTIVETKAPEGYVLDETVYPFTIDSDNYEVTQEMEFTDEVIENEIGISKVETGGSEELPGAEIEIKDENGNLVDSWTSTTEEHFTTLEFGKYEICETKAPVGHVLETECINFEVTEDGVVQHFTLENDVLTSDIVLTKVDSETNEHLKGAEFELLKKNASGEYENYNKLGKNFVTDKNGYINLEAVPWGDYALREIKAPNGYVLNDELIPFEVTEDGATIELSFPNDQLEMAVTGNKTAIKIIIGLLIVLIALAVIKTKVLKIEEED